MFQLHTTQQNKCFKREREIERQRKWMRRCLTPKKTFFVVCIFFKGSRQQQQQQMKATKGTPSTPPLPQKHTHTQTKKGYKKAWNWFFFFFEISLTLSAFFSLILNCLFFTAGSGRVFVYTSIILFFSFSNSLYRFKYISSFFRLKRSNLISSNRKNPLRIPPFRKRLLFLLEQKLNNWRNLRKSSKSLYVKTQWKNVAIFSSKKIKNK